MDDGERRRERLLAEASYRAHRLASVVAGVWDERPEDAGLVLDYVNKYLSQVGLVLQVGVVEEEQSSRCRSVRAALRVEWTSEPQDFRCDGVRGHSGDHFNCTAYPGRREIRWPSKG